MPLFQGKSAEVLIRGFAGTGPKEKQYIRAQIPCPKCKKELVYTEPSVIHHKPNRKRILCRECALKGWHNLETNTVDESN